MKVLYWTARFWPHIGGVEVWSQQLMEALRARGVEFHVVTSHSAALLPDEDEHAGIPIHRFPFLPALTNGDLPQMAQTQRRLAKLKEQFRADLYHIHFSGPESVFHWQTRRAAPAPTLVTLHAIPPRTQEPQSLLATTLRRAEHVNTVSAFMLDRVRMLAPDIHARLSLIRNGLRLPEVEPAPLPFDPPQLLCLGRLVRWKGFHLALSAFARIRNAFPQARMVIAGDGPERNALREQAEELGVAQHVHMPGWVAPEHVPQLLNESTLVLLPSLEEENLPVVATQAAQMARPVIAHRLAGLPEVVDDGETGLLTAPRDIEALAAAVCQLLRSPEVTAGMGRRAREKVVEYWNPERCAHAYWSLYESLTEKAAAGG